MTFAVRGVFPVACRLFVYIGSGTTNFGTAYFQGDAAERTLVLKLTKPDGLTGDEVVNVYISPDTGSTGTAAVVRWAALLRANARATAAVRAEGIRGGTGRMFAILSEDNGDEAKRSRVIVQTVYLIA